jgi:D-alanine-D-alanine ligase
VTVARPAVIFGGPSPEHDISILSGLQSARALVAAGQEPWAIYWAKTGEFHLVPALLEARDYLTGVPPKAQRLELSAGPGGGFVAAGGGLFKKATSLEVSAVVIACHGGPGEDGTLQAALDLAGVRYTGPSAAGAALGMDKLAFGAVMAANGVAALPRHALTAGAGEPEFSGPYIVKPRFGGSSIGIEITDDLDTARALARTSPHFRDGAVIEPYLADAADLNVALRTWPELRLSGIEKPLRRAAAGAIYSYADKYLGGGEGLSGAPRELPADLPGDVSDRVLDLARRVAPLVLVRGAPRIDFLWRGDEIWVNEINTIPGSMGFYFWAAEGVSAVTVLSDLLAEATAAPTRRFMAEGADGTALRSAGSIAGKLA